jgi:hypothetical protein
MKARKILIFDDEKRRANEWAANLRKVLGEKSAFTVEKPLDEQELVQAVENLGQRRQGNQQAKITWDNRFDQADIFIIDFALLKMNRITYVTGESLAYLARCYSRCGLIVALNQFVGTDFDLTLKGHPDSFADLNVNGKHIDDQGLWREPWKGTGFRPWAWSLLPKALVTFEGRVTELLEPIGNTKRGLDEPILSFLGLERIAEVLPRSTLEFIQTRKRRVTETTFRDFVLSSQQGLRPKEEPLDEESIARIAAARIHKWLERLVLPSQDILVDAPHLVSRFPSLLKGNPVDRKVWDRAVTFDLPLKSVLRTDLIERFRFKRTNWVSRPCWFWGELSGYEKIAEVRNPWKTIEKADVVFCEDVSSFLPRKRAKEFVADVASPFVRRYIKEVANVDYQPRVRLAM